jgi:hypothetical protein
VVVEGAPVSGGTKTIQSSGAGDLGLHLGARSPKRQSLQPGASGVGIMQIALAAGSIDGARVTRVRFTSTGSGVENAEVVNVRLFEDVDSDGAIGAGDVQLGSGSYAADNGMITFSGITGLTVAAGSTKHLLLAYDFASGISGVQTYAALVLTGGDVSATGVASSQAIVPAGAPVVGAYTSVGSSAQNNTGDNPSYSIGGCSAASGNPLGFLAPFLALAALGIAFRSLRRLSINN